MKQALIIVNALLVIAVSFLLYKQFARNSEPVVTAKTNFKDKDSSNRKVTFAYMNLDSIQNNYEFAKVLLREVEKRKENLEAEINKMDRAYQTKIEGYQKRGATMTEEQVNAAKVDVQETQRQMFEKRQSLESEFQNWTASKNLSLMKNIQDYLKKFNADGTYSFIFSYEPGLFYYSDSTYDITNQVLKGLNQQYETEKKNKK